MSEPTTRAGRAYAKAQRRAWGSWGAIGTFDIPAIEAEARQQALAPVLAALTDEDEIAHGEAVTWHGNDPDAFVGLGRCAYCEDDWPCRTQRAIDRLLALIRGAA